VVERAVYRWDEPAKPISAIQFDPFASPWSPGAAAAPAPAAVAEQAIEGAAPAASAPPPHTDDFRAAVLAYERQLLEGALRANRFNQRATAAALSLSYDQLRHALKRHKLMDLETA
jgi:psp operon transcriptional activator